MEKIKVPDLNIINQHVRSTPKQEEEDDDEFFLYLSEQIHDVNSVWIDIDQIPIFFQQLLSEDENERINALF